MKMQAVIFSLGFFLTVLLFLPTYVQAESFDKLHKGDTGEKVEWLQSELVERGYLAEADVTDVFDESTQTAVSEFQQNLGLHVDGVAGKQTLGAIKVLREGSEGPLVEELQKRLADLNYYSDSIDGKYGPLTKAAVLKFQTQNGLMVDGIAGPQTHKYLYYNGTVQSKQAKQTTQAPAEQKQASANQANASEKPKQSSEPKQSSDQQNQSSESKQANESKSSSETKAEDKSASSNSSSEASSSASSTESKPAGKTMQMEATAYTAYCNGCSGVTRTGIDLRANPNQKVVAVDPNVIPLGTRVYVEGYGEAIAGDTGGAIKGNKIDLYVQTKDEALTFGRQQVQVTILD
ncbi:3D (Asp-Asp-Asp) domain-containing protein/lysozyme family protein [Alkalihalobacillus xiaoxiensis]|uniref:3D (Asp-Asp-Asp) domain-containing protein/lysozyme family protein n=1 Tax=Shouchella xiaoxiensis TaxID=766895 RepID=A0ABS2SZR8_9BACI|nr:peptidoglycan-binding protein [Shouchella xiaoxiensis]MBM7841026.1 3D (Asp-Asp-Asp) domain-containing protein/lysozyme family protein [Shouchella xiaoxiensis]